MKGNTIKSPRNFRNSQNWVGGNNINNAFYVPPNHEEVCDLMSDLEKFINNDNKYDLLTTISLVHYQFETIHPFLDGNGRIGRMLALLMLMDKKILTYPILYLSYYLKKNKIDYIGYLSKVRNSGDYESWICFFTQAIAESSKESYRSIKEINSLITEHKHILQKNKCKHVTFNVYNLLLKKPIININYIKTNLGVSFKTASLHVKKLIEYKILFKTDNKQKNQTFVYKSYIAILACNTDI